MTDQTRLLLMAEFGTEEPLWLLSPEGKAGRGIPLDRLPLTEDLKQKLRTWTRHHDELNDPPFSWGTRDELEEFMKEGRSLLFQIREELGSGYDIHDRIGN
jgi:hypothetical protein